MKKSVVGALESMAMFSISLSYLICCRSCVSIRAAAAAAAATEQKPRIISQPVRRKWMDGDGWVRPRVRIRRWCPENLREIRDLRTTRPVLVGGPASDLRQGAGIDMSADGDDMPAHLVVSVKK